MRDQDKHFAGLPSVPCQLPGKLGPMVFAGLNRYEHCFYQVLSTLVHDFDVKDRQDAQKLCEKAELITDIAMEKMVKKVEWLAMKESNGISIK